MPLLLSPNTLDKIYCRLTSPNVPRVFLSVNTLWRETISVDNESIFLWASSIFVSLSITLLNVLLVFSKFWSSLSLTLSFIRFNLISILSFNFSKSSLKSLEKLTLKSAISFVIFDSNLPSLSVISLLPLFRRSMIKTRIIDKTKSPIII